MPIISKFYGIIIRMYFEQSEHNPPHIHAIYGEYVAAIDFHSKKIIEGNLPTKALELVFEWIDEHEEELTEIWNTQNFKRIEPLK